MRELVNENNAHIQKMLADLLVEAGWTEKDFLDALVRDVAANGRDRWMVPSPSLAPALQGPLEGERQPTRTKSGTQPKVQPSHGGYRYVRGKKVG